jgi:hypothetical protein
LLGKGLNTIIGGDTAENIYKQRKDLYKELLNIDKQNVLLEEDKKSITALIQSGFLSEKDKNVLAQDLFKNEQEIINKRNALINVIKEHLSRDDPFNVNNK